MSVVYFTDRDLGNAFPSTLEAHGLAVERHAAHDSEAPGSVSFWYPKRRK